MLRVIREVRPTWVVGENVPGLINWSSGVVFEEVQSDLEAAGYEVQSYVLPACGVDAPHRRERVWIIAYAPNAYDNRKIGKARGNEGESGKERLQKRNEIQQLEKPDSLRPTNTKAPTDTDSGKRCEGRMHQDRPKETERYLSTFDTWKNRGNWENFPTQSPIRNGNDGVPAGLVRHIRERSGGVLTEEEINQLVQKTISRVRKEAIKAGGNAIVPQVALQIFKAIDEYSQITA